METNNKEDRAIANHSVGGRTLWAVFISVFVLVLFAAGAATNETDKNEKNKPPKETSIIDMIKPKDVTISCKRDELTVQKIFVGSWSEKITNPHCLDFNTLIKNTDDYQEVRKKKLKQGDGKYWILMAHASDVVQKLVDDYAKIHKISFICDREFLLTTLRKQEDFKNQSDDYLITRFDLTSRMIESKHESKQAPESPKETLK
jgi:hypothetical protein